MERYQKQVRLSYTECDFHGELRPSAMMRHIQEAAGEHLDALSISRELLWEEGYVFLLTRVRLKIHKIPTAGETIKIVTQPYPPKGAQYFRRVFFNSMDGKTLAIADTAWVLANPDTHKIIRPSEFPHQIHYAREDYDYGWIRERIQKPDTLEPVGNRTLRWSDIDVNMHMNNAVYSDIMLDCLPEQCYRKYALQEYTICFIGEAQLGDKLTLFAKETAPGIWFVGAQKRDGPCFETITKWKNRAEQE